VFFKKKNIIGNGKHRKIVSITLEILHTFPKIVIFFNSIGLLIFLLLKGYDISLLYLFLYPIWMDMRKFVLAFSNIVKSLQKVDRNK
jgi:hypothetical protein